MSARSQGSRVPGDTDDIVGTARAHATVPRRSALYSLVATDWRSAGTVARLALGFVMLPHALQKTVGWFGGSGFKGTIDFFTGTLALPRWLAALTIGTELVCSLLLVLGAFTRIGAIGIMGIMIGAVVIVHTPHGFFMNWTGSQKGEGIEYHLLAIGLGLVAFIVGGGAMSIDRLLMPRRMAEGGSLPEPMTRD